MTKTKQKTPQPEKNLDKKLEFIFGLDELKEKDFLKVKSLLVDLYEEKYGEIPIINL